MIFNILKFSLKIAPHFRLLQADFYLSSCKFLPIFETEFRTPFLHSLKQMQGNTNTILLPIFLKTGKISTFIYKKFLPSYKKNPSPCKNFLTAYRRFSNKYNKIQFQGITYQRNTISFVRTQNFYKVFQCVEITTIQDLIKNPL